MNSHLLVKVTVTNNNKKKKHKNVNENVGNISLHMLIFYSANIFIASSNVDELYSTRIKKARELSPAVIIHSILTIQLATAIKKMLNHNSVLAKKNKL